MIRYHRVPASRLATFDTFSVGLKRHHVSALLEADITLARSKLRSARRSGKNISLTAWLIGIIARTVADHPRAAAYFQGKRTLKSFDQIKVALLIEKTVNGEKVPLPLLIDEANTKNPEEITSLIARAVTMEGNADIITINQSSGWLQHLYYHLPGSIRRLFWKVLIKKPDWAYGLMGNVSISSLSGMGKINGWFIHRSVHPISFGLGAVVKKPAIYEDQVCIREMLHFTVLLDHDLIDGAPMVRFVNDLIHRISEADGL